MDITKTTPEKQASTSRTSRVNTDSNTQSATTTTTGMIDSFLEDCQQQQPPCSPSSSSTSQTTGDTTFDPSIDMMVNDFDDEQTLTEEEALAELEAKDPCDEIAALQLEGEMPLEELLAHYKQHVEEPDQRRQQIRKKSMKKNRLRKQLEKKQSPVTTLQGPVRPESPVRRDRLDPKMLNNPNSPDPIIVIESDSDEYNALKIEIVDTDVEDGGSIRDDTEDNQNGEEEDDGDGDDEDGQFDNEEEAGITDAVAQFSSRVVDFSSRSHLLELYPEKFTNINQKLGEDVSDEDDDEEEDDLDYVKKTIMVGSAYQATIPVDLSKYGDVLPYENEDKLVWEPSQVSEQEIEEYLINVREIRTTIPPSIQEEEIPSSSTSQASESDHYLIKDDEQALHLLVQCGYNFKEALRRKRLNAVPLTGSMSLWSEEECKNFEEGIQKFGKDFRKIRQTQVRTRSIRELVQFYYLWKKTDRRDQDFVDSDTIDQMDMYLDSDERDTGTNGGDKRTSSENLSSNPTLQTKKHQHSGGVAAASSSSFGSFSIMNETKRLGAVSSNSKQTSGKKKLRTDAAAQRRRRSSLFSIHKTHHRTKGNSESSSSAGAKQKNKNNANSSKNESSNKSNATTVAHSSSKQ